METQIQNIESGNLKVTYLVCPLQSFLDLVLNDVIRRVDAGNIVDGLCLAADAPAVRGRLLREAVRGNLGLGVNLHP